MAFLPSCGEPLAVLDNTLRYVSKMTWRGPMTVYVLDDSAATTYVASPITMASGRLCVHIQEK